MQKIRLIDANALLKSETERCNCVPLVCTTALNGMACDCDSLKNVLDRQQTIEAEPVRHGRWIECDYKHIEHGMIETEPKAGLCCSECRTAFQKKKMTYKQYCAACGARMDGGADNG